MTASVTVAPARHDPALAPGWWRRNRPVALIAGGLVVLLLLLGVLTSGGTGGMADPDAYDPAGARALSVLLRDNGVEVVRTDDLPTTTAAAQAASTVFVPWPGLMSAQELKALASLPGDLVVAGAGDAELAALGVDVEAGSPEQSSSTAPDCELEVATRAGSTGLGGLAYDGPDVGTACYRGRLVTVPSAQLTLLGSPSFLTNDEIDEDGNAALAVGLLGQPPRLVWLIPARDRVIPGGPPVTSPEELLPDGVASAAWQLLLAVLLLALWRARRLGRVVPEPLPVAVRAAETTEGRGRLYGAAQARDRAAESLRSATRARLGPRVGAGTTPAAGPLVAGLVARTSRSAQDLNDLLYGPPPADDAALVRLADDLDALTREVTGP